mmetsp:Transcript_1488/g.1908  ORF Transcript_1488/g.1908 Transcript_1488/m.1908 type:complete len:447 (-) Transcript_1488:88-1428(-)|eukprot:CAMPEP_0204845734 /NCGR_PEP_ID=MMETSP1347-20130617/1407_1 /ASSEMBLY_ACC=CAM_ASM_000690 /TAXON_ID=215587 /ORGANISM="Aplanochytrium stocchinoi, Strain GSBS06" /LENGTH=446 /DNA_ID=CAMNT_0051985943 /DNA_START=741 /DNA_END=2081 /DNA_ORIENTATION=+
MSGLLNINGSDDPSYRYKMPRIVGKVEGRGNGIRTVIVNCSEVAQSLKRSPGQITKFFGCELGARSEYKEDLDRSTVSGAIDSKNLQEMLTIYIDKFVLCSECNNPETVQKLRGSKKSTSIELHCKACGAVSEADSSHKLCTYIFKEMGPEKSANKKEERKKKKLEKAMKKATSGESESQEGDSDVSKDRKKEKKEKKKKKDKKKKKEYTEEELERKRKKKEKKRREKEMLASMENGKSTPENGGKSPEDEASTSSDCEDGEPLQAAVSSISIDDVAAIDSAANSINAFIAKDENAKVSEVALLEQVKMLQTNCGLRPQDKIAVLFFAICDLPIERYEESSYFPALGKLVSNQEEEKEVLACMEEMVTRALPGAAQETAKSRVPLVLKFLYDEDVVEEETIIDWYSGKIKVVHERSVVPDTVVAEIKAKAEPIITWLKEADEDDEE